jgi:predicted DCC family thiol-disulfide oxidoreductase YuxK
MSIVYGPLYYRQITRDIEHPVNHTFRRSGAVAREPIALTSAVMGVHLACVERPVARPLASVLLYDGSCAFCNRSVRFILAREKHQSLRFASLEGAVGRRCLQQFPELDTVDSLIWIDEDSEGRPVKALARSAAAIRIARYMGGTWTLFSIFWLVPKPLRDWVYDLIAKHRHNLIGQKQCVVFPSEVKHRIIDGSMD